MDPLVQFGIGVVGSERSPISINDDDGATGAGDPLEFGQRRLGTVEPLQRALRATSVKGVIGELEILSVTQSELGCDASRLGAPGGFVDHDPTGVNADNSSAWAELAGEGDSGVSGAAPDVEKRLLPICLQPGDGLTTQLLGRRPSAGLIHCLDEHRRVWHLIDTGEAGRYR